jgi:hypothetical protein
LICLHVFDSTLYYRQVALKLSWQIQTLQTHCLPSAF